MNGPTIAAAILAGGRARRFGGQDKSRLIVEGRSIILRQIEVLQRVAGEILVVGPDAARFSDLPCNVVPDIRPELGAIGGLYTALASTRASCTLVVACDLPFLDASLLARLVELAHGADGAWVRTFRGIEPLIACYAQSALDIVRGQVEAGRLKMRDLATVLDMRSLEGPSLDAFGPADRLLANINTPDDYARVQYRPS